MIYNGIVMRVINIFVADDHSLFREGLCRILSSTDYLKIIGTANNGTDAITKIIELKPDIAILDIEMDTKSGIEVVREIKKYNTDTRMIMLTAFDYEKYLIECLNIGVDGYMLKTTTADKMIDCIKKVAVGEKEFDTNIITKVMNTLKNGAEVTDESVKLSNREIEIMLSIGRGKTNKEISQDMGISLYTVGNHINSILSKLNVNCRTAAVTKAIDIGLIDVVSIYGERE